VAEILKVLAARGKVVLSKTKKESPQRTIGCQNTSEGRRRHKEKAKFKRDTRPREGVSEKTDEHGAKEGPPLPKPEGKIEKDTAEKRRN